MLYCAVLCCTSRAVNKAKDSASLNVPILLLTDDVSIVLTTDDVSIVLMTC